MEDEEHVVVIVQFKVILKKILEKLRLPATSYKYEKHGPDHRLCFVAKVKFENKFGKHKQYQFKAYTKKEAENEDALHVIRHLQNFYNIIIKDMSEKELYETNYELEYLKNTNKRLIEDLLWLLMS